MSGDETLIDGLRMNTMIGPFVQQIKPPLNSTDNAVGVLLVVLVGIPRTINKNEWQETENSWLGETWTAVVRFFSYRSHTAIPREPTFKTVDPVTALKVSSRSVNGG